MFRLAGKSHLSRSLRNVKKKKQKQKRKVGLPFEKKSQVWDCYLTFKIQNNNEVHCFIVKMKK